VIQSKNVQCKFDSCKYRISGSGTRNCFGYGVVGCETVDIIILEEYSASICRVEVYGTRNWLGEIGCKEGSLRPQGRCKEINPDVGQWE
jgi:hypothetical protein